MAQSKEMKRLLRDGKIVGYMKIDADVYESTRTGKPCLTVYEKRATSESTDWFNDIDLNSYDSFELRSPFKNKNNEWIWEGDILLTDEAGWKGIVTFDGGFFLEDDLEGVLKGFSRYPNWDKCEKIGTIHDEED